jgi:hypothetical protein
MSVCHTPAATVFDLDDGDVPGTYLTDGEALYRVLGAGEPRGTFVAIEDCRSLEVFLVETRELRAWDLFSVCGQRHALAA